MSSPVSLVKGSPSKLRCCAGAKEARGRHEWHQQHVAQSSVSQLPELGGAGFWLKLDVVEDALLSVLTNYSILTVPSSKVLEQKTPGKG